MSTEKEKSTTEEFEEKASAMQAGDLLRIKREQLGISQEEIADRLRLRLSVIKSIDENNYEFEQVATFTRGYLRSYAKAVSLDEKEVLAALDMVSSNPEPGHTMQSFSRKTKKEKHDRRIMKVTWVIILASIGISSVWWYQSQQDTLTESSMNHAAEAVIEQVQAEEQPASPVIDRSNEPASPDRSKFEQPELPVAEQLPELEEQPTEEVVPETVSVEEATESAEEVTNVAPVAEEANTAGQVASPAVEATAATTVSDASSAEAIVMNFSSDCWVQVKDATGTTLATGVKKAGSTLTLSGEAPYSLVLGAPEGVSLTFANEPVDLSGYNSGKVARFTLP